MPKPPAKPSPRQRAAWAKIAAAFLPPTPKDQDEVITGLARLYTGTGDPLHAWAAYHLAQRFARPVPPVVTAYLERVATAMAGLTQAEPTSLTAAVLSALEMSGHGRGAVLAKRRELLKAEQYAADVLALKSKGHNTEDAIYLIGKFHGASRATVLRAYQLRKALGPSRASLSGRLRPSPKLPD
jgi:hypothetical protein